MDETWSPINWRGTIYRDPREELAARARHAQKNYDAWVAILISLALAVAELQECDARTILTSDEDGPLQTPIEIKCRRPKNHVGIQHYNGYCSWY